jgi:SAM-dependent methyltransferase
MTGASPYRDDEWWRDHYSGALLELWQAIIPPERAAEDADFLIRHCALRPGSAVLDLPCGEGRVSIELAARDIAVTGIDIAPGQIELARAAAAQRGLTNDWRVGDMRAPPRGPFDAAFCWGDSFGYMDDAGNRAFLAAVHQVLRPGGRFAMEMEMVAEVLAPRFQPLAKGRAGEFDVALQREWDRAGGRLSVTYRLERGGAVESRRASYRIHTAGELKSLLAGAGFEIERFCDRQGRAFIEGSDCLRIVARAL